MKAIMLALLTVVCFIPSSELARAAEENPLTGTVYLYTAGKQSPTPLSGYEVRVYDPQQKKWSNPSVTDAYGRYAFYGMPKKKHVLTVGKAGKDWHQVVWQQEVAAPGIVKPIVLAQSADIVPHASYTERKGEKDSYDFSLWLDVPAEQQAGIRRVTYIFNNPTFKRKEYESRQANNGFKVEYSGWGCLEKVTIKIERQGANSYLIFKMCDALKLKR